MTRARGQSEAKHVPVNMVSIAALVGYVTSQGKNERSDEVDWHREENLIL